MIAMEGNTMISIYQSEQRNGRIKFSDDVDTLPPDAIRVQSRVFPNMQEVKTLAASFEDRGFTVCIDTYDCEYETES